MSNILLLLATWDTPHGQGNNRYRNYLPEKQGEN